tara:strand:+ start:163 stop:435 length:273 start_codon:yes stop_codon:yes gene_type:complete
MTITHREYLPIHDDGETIYNWTMSTDGFRDKSVLEVLDMNDKPTGIIVFMLQAWPVQIAGERLRELHTAKAGEAHEIEGMPMQLVEDQYK